MSLFIFKVNLKCALWLNMDTLWTLDRIKDKHYTPIYSIIIVGWFTKAWCCPTLPMPEWACPIFTTTGNVGMEIWNIPKNAQGVIFLFMKRRWPMCCQKQLITTWGILQFWNKPDTHTHTPETTDTHTVNVALILCLEQNDIQYRYNIYSPRNSTKSTNLDEKGVEPVTSSACPKMFKLLFGLKGRSEYCYGE